MLYVHLAATMFSFVIVFLSDKEALGWVRGTKQVLDGKRIRLYHTLAWAGLSALIVSGSLLAYPMLGNLLQQPLFIIKMLFVGMLGTNAILIGSLMHIAFERPFAELTQSERTPLYLSGAVSFIGWFGALIAALLLFGWPL